MTNNSNVDFENVLHLIFVNIIGTTSDDLYKYEFLFTSQLDDAWGDNWNEVPAGICGDIPPYEKLIEKKIECQSYKKLDTAQNNTCFSMGDCMDGIIPLAWENVDDYESYPDERLILRFGQDMDKTLFVLREHHFEF